MSGTTAEMLNTNGGVFHQLDVDQSSYSSSEVVLFAEKDVAHRCISIFGNDPYNAEACQQALQDLRRIFDKYMECPSLLDPSMESMVTRISELAITIILQHDSNEIDDDHDSPCHSLDAAFHQTSLPFLFSSLYALSKVRGRKFVQRFLPHEVDHVLPILTTLEHANTLLLQRSTTAATNSEAETAANNIDTETTPLWESLYTLWNWMGMLSLVPFGLSVLADSESTIVTRLVSLAYQHLSHAGAHRETAASCLASWLSRPDLSMALDSFIQWGRQSILEVYQHQPQQQQKPGPGAVHSKRVFLVLGVIHTVVCILKIARCNPTQLDGIMKQMWEPMIRITETKTTNNQSNILVRKLVVKWWSRMACANLAPRVAAWRYQRGRRSLLENLLTTTTTTKTTTTQQKQPDATAGSVNAKKDHDDNEDDDDFFVIPDEVEVAMGHLIDSITDASTVVRWSAAKGVGRLTERLPSLCALDVVDAVLALCKDPDKDHAWHGACLTLAELARRGLLLPTQLPDVVPVVVKAIQYDVQRGNTSVGSAVRDAACYTYWAFARAYSPDVLRPFIRELSQSVVVTSLFDREVNCRRAASAAFQECVGRQGANNFTNGIEILTLADYFSLGNRHDAYTSIAVQVAQFEEYRRPILDHLYKVKLCHWDINIRSLSANALHCLTPLDVPFLCNIVIPSLLVSSLDQNLLSLRHGAVLGIAEILLALGHKADQENVRLTTILQDDKLCASIAELVPDIEKRRLYRGRGGEIMRSAVCRLIACISLARLPLTVKQQVRLLDSVDACLPHPSEVIQKSAASALHDLVRSYFPVGPNGPSDRLQNRVVDKYVGGLNTEDNPAATRGFALALGSLPSKLLAPSRTVLDAVINSLCLASCSNATIGQYKDAETRRNALTSLTRICLTVGIAPSSSENMCVVNISCDQFSRISDAFFMALEDYNTDRRGDVGSWSRIAAMHGLEQIAYSLVSAKSDPHFLRLFNDVIYLRLIGSLLKQLAEKLDSVRNEAGQCLARIITNIDPPISLIPVRQRLLDALMVTTSHEAYVQQNTNWSDAAVTFPMVMNAAHIDELFEYVIAGIVISVGGLTEAVTKCASAAFLQYAKQINLTGRIERLGFALLQLFLQHRYDARVTSPLLKTIDLLLSHRCLDALITSNSGFGQSLILCLKAEEAKSTDIHQLFLITRVTLGLLTASASCEFDQTCCHFACKKLSHRFPRVRRYVAENLYILLLERPDLIVGDHQALVKSLLEAPWDAALSDRQISVMTSIVSSSLGLSNTPHNFADEAQAEASKPLADEFATYAALVHSLDQ